MKQAEGIENVIISSLDDGHDSTTKVHTSLSEKAPDSYFQGGEMPTLPMRSNLVPTSKPDRARSEVDSSMSVLSKSSPITLNHVSITESSDKTISTISTMPSCKFEDGKAIEGKEFKSRNLRSSALVKKATKTYSVEKTLITKEMSTYLEPLLTLEGVSSDIRNIKSWYDEWMLHCNVTKIAEGSFGSVFRLSDKEGVQEATIGKLMPLRPKTGKGSRKAEFIQIIDVVGEVRLLETMSEVPGFVEFRSAEILIGALPKSLKQEYLTYKARCKTKKGSFCETVYPKNQMWVFVEMGDAGTELEDALLAEFEENSVSREDELGPGIISIQDVRDVFWGVADALANGEELQEFEHRDLHFSNICIKRQPVRVDSGYLLVPSNANIEVTLIDYTLSRATIQDGNAVCNGMTDEEIFLGEDDLQFDVYRWMREEMPGQDLHSKDWKAFVPMTNVLWLYHLLVKLMLQTTRPHQNGAERALWESLNDLKDQIHPKNKRSGHLVSATDVVSFARKDGVRRKGPKDNEDRSIMDEFSADESSIENDLSARFLGVHI